MQIHRDAYGQLTASSVRLILRGAMAYGDVWEMADGRWTVLLPADERGLQGTRSGLTRHQAAEALLCEEMAL